ncbi:aromatic-ring-hydroxylating dioxygenase subunit beta [Pusillimonas sp.]|uniref:aromatic-ring-hydroxylating dioxygenase subunit beta n=1 Tax=Pusillimonas sp. TaxID=3040095 RepID=UPI0037C6C450
MDMQTYINLNNLYAEYAAAVDAEDWEKWVSFFEEECEYKVQPRENHERGFPLSTMWFISRNMLEDRVYGIRETLFHDPYYQRHVVGAPRIISFENGVIESEANYAVFRTKYDGESTVFNVGRYIDRIQVGEAGLKFKSRYCIYDSEMIANSIIYPV